MDTALSERVQGRGTAPKPTSFARHEQIFPTLSAEEIGRMRRFGTMRRYADGEILFQTGTARDGLMVLLSGYVTVSQRDGLGHITPVAEQGPGQFIGEIGQLSNQPSLTDGRAETDIEVLVVPAERLRALLIAEAELGERIVRALILRRVNLIQVEAGGPILIGPPSSAGVIRLQGFLSRNAYPHHLLDPETDADARALVERCLPVFADFPLVVCPDGTVLRNPSEAALARQMGVIGRGVVRDAPYDVAVVGAGPAGLATAVYAASEGLSVVVFDARAFGGQAGASARIENFLGFPTGISGQALAGRAFVQAQKFGAEMMIPVSVKALDCSCPDGTFRLVTDDDQSVKARAVVIASGARYRRPALPELPAYEGRGVWYWASPIEARQCVGEEVILVGGGNSAGQAAVFLSGYASKVRIMVRGAGLAESMSRYLIDRLAATPNIDLMTHTEIMGLEGSPERGVERVRWRNRRTAAEESREVHNVFLFVGADPAASWLEGCGVSVDKSGFVVTGVAHADAGASRRFAPLETTVPGVFAVGDVRSGSIKRVGSAIGEGAQVVAALHEFLALAKASSSHRHC